MAAIEHGTNSAYKNHKCRCPQCKQAMREYERERRRRRHVTRRQGLSNENLAELLHEIAPDGLTDDCPVRKARIVAAIRAGEL